MNGIRAEHPARGARGRGAAMIVLLTLVSALALLLGTLAVAQFRVRQDAQQVRLGLAARDGACAGIEWARARLAAGQSPEGGGESGAWSFDVRARQDGPDWLIDAAGSARDGDAGAQARRVRCRLRGEDGSWRVTAWEE